MSGDEPEATSIVLTDLGDDDLACICVHGGLMDSLPSLAQTCKNLRAVVQDTIESTCKDTGNISQNVLSDYRLALHKHTRRGRPLLGDSNTNTNQ